MKRMLRGVCAAALAASLVLAPGTVDGAEIAEPGPVTLEIGGDATDLGGEFPWASFWCGLSDGLGSDVVAAFFGWNLPCGRRLVAGADA